MPRKRNPNIGKLPKVLREPIVPREVKPCPDILDTLSLDEAALRKKDADSASRYAMDITLQEKEKMSHLLNHYGLNEKDESSWFKLAYALARDFVPAFDIKEKEKRGRNPVWIPPFQIRLWIDVQELMLIKKCSARSACEMLVCRQFWKQKLADGKAKSQGNAIASSKEEMRETLYRRYQEAKKNPFIKMAQECPKEKQSQILQELLTSFNLDGSS